MGRVRRARAAPPTAAYILRLRLHFLDRSPLGRSTGYAVAALVGGLTTGNWCAVWRAAVSAVEGQGYECVGHGGKRGSVRNNACKSIVGRVLHVKLCWLSRRSVHAETPVQLFVLLGCGLS